MSNVERFEAKGSRGEAIIIVREVFHMPMPATEGSQLMETRSAATPSSGHSECVCAQPQRFSCSARLGLEPTATKVRR